MSTVYYEKLQPSKCDPHRCIQWEPSAVVKNAGRLVLDRQKCRTVFFVVEVPHDNPAVRAFHFQKDATTPGTDREAESYTVQVGQAGQSVACECRGFLRWNRPCAHILAADAVLANGWMDRDQTNPDRDTENTEPF
jgi:hypothetical protein